MTLTVSQLGPSCPSGGRFYVCDSAAIKFLGCCKVDPCSRGGVCPQANLATTTFNADSFGDIPPQNCTNAPGATSWYTCKGSKPPFMGCCSINPCVNSGCPSDKLLAARLSEKPIDAAVFLPASTTSGGSSAPSSTSSSSSTPAPPPAASKGISTGAIAGIAVGAFVLILALVLGLVFWRRRRNRQRESRVIAEFPAKYIPGALPDMGQASYSAAPSPGKDMDSSYRSAYNHQHHHSPDSPCCSPSSPTSITKPRPSLASSSGMGPTAWAENREENASSQAAAHWRPTLAGSYLSSTTGASNQPLTTPPASAGLHPSSQRVSMLSAINAADSHGQYSRVSSLPEDSEPDHHPHRFNGPTPDLGGGARFEDPSSFDALGVSQEQQQQQRYHPIAERPFSELPGSEAPPEAMQQGPSWRAYRPV